MRLSLLTIPLLFVVNSIIAVEPATVRVMSFNIRYDNPHDGDNAWQHRKDWVGELIAEQKLDVVGLQEVVAGQLADLKEHLPGMSVYGVGRDDGQQKGEFVPIFHREERWKRIDQGTFWLSPTPDKAGSQGWDAALPRIASWVKLQEKQTGEVLIAINTHFDHRGEQARQESAKLLLQRVQHDFANLPVVLTGDFNTLPQSTPYNTLVGIVEADALENSPVADQSQPLFRDSFVHGSKRPRGPASTWNGFKAIVPQQRIDFVFVTSAWKVRQQHVLENQRKGRFPSDHLPVVVELEWPPIR